MKKKMVTKIISITLIIIMLTMYIPSFSGNKVKATNDEIETGVGEESELTQFTYTKDDTNKTVTLKRCNKINKTYELTIYSKYKINDVEYSTIIEKDDEESFIIDSHSNNYHVIFQNDIILKGNAKYFFKNCKRLETVSFGGVHYANPSNTSLEGMFSGCDNLRVVDFQNANFDTITDISKMFYQCKGLRQISPYNHPIYFGNFTGKNIVNMASMFYQCESLNDLSFLNDLDTSNVTNMYNMFSQCDSLSDITPLNNLNTSKVTNMHGMFSDCIALTDISPLNNLNTSKVTNMDEMFSDCVALTDISPLKNWNTSNVQNMRGMFLGCNSLSNVNIGNWDTSNVERMDWMFFDCYALSDISSLNNWNTSNVERMDSMFFDCSSLENVNLNNWNTSNVVNMDEMFFGCTSLNNIDLNNWNTANVTDMESMFSGCTSLNNISIKSWNTANVTDVKKMFQNCRNLMTLDISNFNIYNAIDTDIFKGCNFEIIITPKVAYQNTTSLPYVMYTEDGDEYTKLPTTSMTLYKEKPVTYTVIFISDGETLSTQKIKSGGAAQAPANPTKTGYTFAGWDKDFSNVTSDLTVNANWTQNKYTVTFKNGNETISTQEVAHGEAAQAPTAPQKEGYTFTGWDKDFSNVTSNLEVNAQWKANTYTVTLETNEGTIAEGENVTSYTYGVGATLPTPTRVGYTFAGWYINEDLTGEAINTIGTKATGNKTYYAKWTQSQFTVIFKNGDEVISTQTIAYGQPAQAPTAPQKEGYTFTGWDKDFSNVTSDLEVNAKWTVSIYTVTLNTNGGTIAEGENVTSYTYGVGAILPTPSRVGYTFAGWYKTEDLTGEAIHTIGTGATGDKTYYAKWEEGTGIVYKIEHYKQNLETNTYDKVDTEDFTGKTGMTVTAKPKTYEGYTENTSHQDRIATGEIASDGSLVLKLYYDVNQYTVTFKDGDEVVSTQTVAYGGTATAPTITKDKYVLRWDKSYNNVTSNLTVNAVWLKDTDGDGIPDIEDDDTQVAYKVKHYKQVGNTNEYRLEETQELIGQLGQTVTAVAKNYQGYVENTNVKERIPTGEVVEDGSLELRLFYDTIKYTVTFKNEDTLLKTETVVHGEAAVAPETPTKEGYTFAGWDKDFTNITSNLEVKAIWTKNQEEPKEVGYKVEHYKQNSTTNTYEKVATEELIGTIGSTVTAIAKTYEGYHENTSHKDRVVSGVVVEDGSLVLKLYYDINQYTVTFKDGDKVVKEETVTHGGNATPPIITKPGYILSWDKGTDNVTGDTTFTAVWTKDPNYVDPNDGKEEKPSKLPQTGENCMIIGSMSVLMSAAILVYLKYRKIDK